MKTERSDKEKKTRRFSFSFSDSSCSLITERRRTGLSIEFRWQNSTSFYLISTLRKMIHNRLFFCLISSVISTSFVHRASTNLIRRADWDRRKRSPSKLKSWRRNSKTLVIKRDKKKKFSNERKKISKSACLPFSSSSADKRLLINSSHLT